ncbi:MAG: hypothetical protein QOK64_02570 [Nitrososphaeraceae archaeon]|nr:hypothetical protein [Nitrososphaeraceae archaeon]
MKTTSLGTDSRKEQRRKDKKRKKRFSFKHEDPEIQAELRKGNIMNVRSNPSSKYSLVVISFLDLIFIFQIHLLQSQGLLQGHSSVQGQEQQHDFISLILKIISTSFFFNVLWFLF